MGLVRPWRIGSVSHSWDELGQDAEANAAASALTSIVLERDLDRLRDWLARRRHTAAPEWRNAAFMSEALIYLTPDELEALGKAVTELLLEYLERTDPARRPEGSAPVKAIAVGFPLRTTATGN